MCNKENLSLPCFLVVHRRKVGFEGALSELLSKKVALGQISFGPSYLNIRQAAGLGSVLRYSDVGGKEFRTETKIRISNCILLTRA